MRTRKEGKRTHTLQVSNSRRPARGDCLVRGVSPGVAVVQVQVDAQPGRVGALGQLQVVVEVVVAVGRVDPDALADGVHAGVGEDALERARRAGRGRVRLAVVLLDGDRGPVHTLVGEGRGGERDAAEEREGVRGEHSCCCCCCCCGSMGETKVRDDVYPVMEVSKVFTHASKSSRGKRRTDQPGEQLHTF